MFDDEVDSIRLFDQETQCSLNQVGELHLLPAHEYPLTEVGITTFRQNWREQFTGNPARSPLYQAVSEGISAPGVEYYLPLFFNELQTLFNYLPLTSLVFSVGNITTAAELFWQEVNERYTQLSGDQERPILPPRAIITPIDELFGLMKPFQHIKLTEESAKQVNVGIKKPPILKIDPHTTQPFAELARFLQSTDAPVLFIAESAGRREVLIELLSNINIKPKSIDYIEDFNINESNYSIITAPLFRGAQFTQPPFIILTEGELFGEQVLQQRRRIKRGPDPDTLIRNLTELQIGAPIVHLDHGVGRYLGLQRIETAGVAAEYLTIEYAEHNKLYVPVSSLHLISRYTGADSEHAPIYSLGTQRWQKAKRKAAEQARDVAVELLDIYARREAKSRDGYTLPSQDYASFVAEFPFEETPDQQQAIQAVLDDLTTAKPMDRLVCGDVGFGKTEVAMRAAYIVASQNKQVAVLVPTTLLADQHFTNFRDRFAATGLTVEMLSRFRNAKEQKEIMGRLSVGRIDIIIGTHKLLQSDINFHNLGLLIIDEEQRFGVHQKERIKSLRANIDILTLTATPIPRTLNMAMARIRDLSIIATPPARRLAINTFVREYNPSLIKEALLREILRGGQVYYLHNDVKSIAQTAAE
nr:DEAD/DEAH box helicase [Pseudomonadota bacterium]